MAAWFRSPSSVMGSAETFSVRSRLMPGNSSQMAKSPTCDCGKQQTMSHIVDSCPLTKFDGGLQLLHIAEDDIVKWLASITTTAFVK